MKQTILTTEELNKRFTDLTSEYEHLKQVISDAKDAIASVDCELDELCDVYAED